MNAWLVSIINVVCEHFKWALFSFFENNYIYLSLVLIAVAFIILYRKKMTQAYYLLILFSLPVLLIIFNPYVVSYLKSFPGFNKQVSSRFWIIVPVWIAVAFVLSLALSKIRLMKVRYPVGIAIAVLLVLAGASTQEMGYHIRAEGRYKIRADSVQIADMILSFSAGEPASVLMFVPEEEGNGHYVWAGTVAEGIRQYSGNISVHKSKYSQDRWDNYFMSDIVSGDTEQTSEAYIGSLLYKYYCENIYDYVIWHADDIILEKMGYCGYELVGQTEEYYIYRYSPRPDAAQIASELLRLSEGQTVSVIVMDFIQEDTFNSVNGGSLNSSIRYYSTDITTKAEGISKGIWGIFTSESAPEESPEAVDYEYVIIPEDDRATRNMEYLGFEQVSSVAGYSIFMNQ